jgi:hypothetical protein
MMPNSQSSTAKAASAECSTGYLQSTTDRGIVRSTRLPNDRCDYIVLSDRCINGPLISGIPN